MSEIGTVAQPPGLAGYSMMRFAPPESYMAVLRTVGVGARSVRWHCTCPDEGRAVFVG
jgi:hypothetical protein